jgi:hypothetical protein
VGYIRNILFQYPDVKETERKAVEGAIRETEGVPSGADTLKIIDMVFTRKTHTLDGAALAVGYSYRQARRLQTAFYKRVARHLGLP